MLRFALGVVVGLGAAVAALVALSRETAGNCEDEACPRRLLHGLGG